MSADGPATYIEIVENDHNQPQLAYCDYDVYDCTVPFQAVAATQECMYSDACRSMPGWAVYHLYLTDAIGMNACTL
jgi:hypothetical protein